MIWDAAVDQECRALVETLVAEPARDDRRDARVAAWRALLVKIAGPVEAWAKGNRVLRRCRLTGDDDARAVLVAVLERLAARDYANLRRFAERRDPDHDSADEIVTAVVRLNRLDEDVDGEPAHAPANGEPAHAPVNIEPAHAAAKAKLGDAPAKAALAHASAKADAAHAPANTEPSHGGTARATSSTATPAHGGAVNVASPHGAPAHRGAASAMSENDGSPTAAAPDVASRGDGSTFAGDTPFRAWLLRLVEFVARDHVRERLGWGSGDASKRDLHSDAAPLSAIPERGTRPPMTDRLTVARMVTEMQDFIATFPADMKAALDLWLDDVPLADIATRLSLDDANRARALVRAGQARLRDKFRGRSTMVFA